MNARHYLTYLAGAPLLFVALFVFASPTSDLLQHSTGETAAVNVNVPVVFVVLDELPTASLLNGTGHIDPVLFPGFARLAASTTWYRNSTTVAAITSQAVPAILTGKYPKEEPPAPTANQYPHNLFTFLGGGNTTLHVQEFLTALCPPRPCSPGGQRGLRGLLHQSLDLWNNRFHHTTAIQGFVGVVGDHRLNPVRSRSSPLGSRRRPERDSISCTRCSRTCRGGSCPPDTSTKKAPTTGLRRSTPPGSTPKRLGTDGAVISSSCCTSIIRSRGCSTTSTRSGSSTTRSSWSPPTTARHSPAASRSGPPHRRT